MKTHAAARQEAVNSNHEGSTPDPQSDIELETSHVQPEEVEQYSNIDATPHHWHSPAFHGKFDIFSELDTLNHRVINISSDVGGQESSVGRDMDDSESEASSGQGRMSFHGYSVLERVVVSIVTCRETIQSSVQHSW